MLDWFELQHAAGPLSIEYSSETWRSVQAIATFSDTLFPAELKFPSTASRQQLTSEHDGVFAVAPKHVDAYLETFQPACLRQLVTAVTPEGVDAANFGISKGLTHQRVLIFTTGPMRTFLPKGTALAGKSACSLYVGVTRAVYSVAFVMTNPHQTGLAAWEPN